MKGIFWGIICGFCVCSGYFVGKYGGVSLNTTPELKLKNSMRPEMDTSAKALPKLSFFEELRKPPIYIPKAKPRAIAVRKPKSARNRPTIDKIPPNSNLIRPPKKNISLEERIARILGQAT